jgi:protein-disulfide isomerase
MNIIMETPEKKSTQNEKNLVALAIILTGLFVGSLFVDFVQLATGSGFSKHVVDKLDIIETGERTWVAYTEPEIKLEVISDKDCMTCNSEDAIVWIKRLVPTATIVPVDSNSPLGKERVKDFHLKVLPAFIFDEKVEKTAFYDQASDLFEKVDSHLSFAMNKIGFTGGKFMNPPTTEANDILLGNPDAKVKIVVYSDFECQYCKDFHAELTRALTEYGDQISVTYRHLPLSFHKQAPLAALASQCAYAQNKFPEYSDSLFTNQSTWSETTGTQWFNAEAKKLGLNQRTFAACMNKKTFAEKIANDAFSAQEFGITGTPSAFVNTTLLSGAVDYDTLKKVIDSSLVE